jgi:hypothetical protein
MDIEKEIYALNEELDKLTKGISETRKQGKDAKMAEIFIIGLAHKIKYAEISEDQKDIDYVKRQLAKIRFELEHAEEK